MKLWVVRHGDAGAYSPDPTTERARRLTVGGRKTVEAVARKLADSGAAPKLILASPFARTIESADILGRILDAPVDTEDCMQPHRPLARFVAHLAADDDVRRVMLVGHVDNLIPALAALGERDVDRLAKGEARALRIDRASGDWTERYRILPSDVGQPDLD